MQGLATVIGAAAAMAVASPASPVDRAPVAIEERVDGDGAVTLTWHNAGPVPITADLSLWLTDMVVDDAGADAAPAKSGWIRLTREVAPRARARGAHLLPAHLWSSPRYRYRWAYRFGRRDARPDEVPYHLPWAVGGRYWLGQGYFGKLSHAHEHALDFRMPEGTPVLAARAGIVAATEGSFTRGGLSPDLRAKSNYVVVAHADGTIGTYRHLAFHGVAVQVGQQVRVGQRLGSSGNTGFSSKPHLHFDVRVPSDGHHDHTVPTRFVTRAAPGGEPLQPGRFYEAR